MKTAFWDFSAGATEGMMLGALIAAGLDVAEWSTAMERLSFPDWELLLARDQVRSAATARIKANAAPIGVQEFRAWLLKAHGGIAAARMVENLPVLGAGETAGVLTSESAICLIGIAVGCTILDIAEHLRTPLWVGAGVSPAAMRLVGQEPLVLMPGEYIPLSAEGIFAARSLASPAAGPAGFLVRGAGCGTTEERVDRHESGASYPCVRLLWGERERGDHQRAYEVRATIDDMDPELLPPLLVSLRDAGAFDAWWSPAVTRGGRPAVTVHVVCPAERLGELNRMLFLDTTTIGLRFHEIHRIVLPRSVRSVKTEIGEVHIKEATLPDGKPRWKAELEDCLKLARRAGITPAQVRELVRQAVERDSRP